MLCQMKWGGGGSGWDLMLETSTRRVDSAVSRAWLFLTPEDRCQEVLKLKTRSLSTEAYTGAYAGTG